MKKLTYKSAGVDVGKADVFVKKISTLAKGIGGFGAFFKHDFKKYKEPILVSSSDGVGTKLKLAFLLGKHDTVGIDLVAMNVNDVLCAGAKPLFFLDYIATGKIDPSVLVDVVKGIASGCRQAGSPLIGGETAEMPDFYKKGEYDLAGFCVGVVDKKNIPDPSGVSIGDKIIGLASSGPHSNGYSLIRKAFSKKKLAARARQLLTPTRIYVKPVLGLMRSTKIKAIAHVTGGAFYGKVPRIIPKGKAFLIYKEAWEIPEIFRLIQREGSIDEREMFGTFNMGIGMVLAVKKADAERSVRKLKSEGVNAWIIGEVIKGNKEILL